MPEQNPISSQKNLSPRAAIIMGIVFLLLGVAVILIGLGVIPANPKTIHAPPWIIVSAGLLFVLCGAAVINGQAAVKSINSDENIPAKIHPKSLIQDLLGLTIIGLFAVIDGWVAFGPGERQFTAGPSSSFSPGSPISSSSGRVAFGISFIVILLIFIAIATKIVRRIQKKN